MSDSAAPVSNGPGPVEGDRLNATIITIDGEQIRVDLGNAVECELAPPDCDRLRATQAKVGDAVEVFLERVREKPYDLVASTIKADKLRLWDTLARAAESDEVVEGEVIAKVKGGLSVDIGVRAFLPASQLELHRVADLDSYIGKRFSLQIIKFGTKRGNIVVSRRQILEAEREGLKAVTLAKIVVGDVLTGHVKNFTPYGAFVDIGGVDGLVHVNDLSWGRIKHPREAVRVGEEIRVEVLEFDPDQERISLGYKQLLPDPWEGIEARFPVGTKIRGSVRSITEYGAFVELEPGLEGLVHVSEMSWKKRVQHPRELLKSGQTIEAIILDLDFNQRRIALGIKQTQDNPWVALRDRVEDGTTLQGVVTGVKDFGVFVEIEDGLEGLVHVSDISWTERIKDASERYKQGDAVKVKVLDINVDSERLSLGIKQLSEDPWAAAAKRFPTGTKLTGKVTKVLDFGALVELEPGIEGLCHISQLAEGRVDKSSDVAKVGGELEVVVIDFNRAKQRVSLSVKALMATGDDYRGYMHDIPDDGTPFGNALGVALADKIKRDAGQ